MNSYLKDLRGYNINPTAEFKIKSISIKEKVIDVFKSVAIYLVLMLLAFIPIFGVMKMVDYFFGIDIIKLRDHMFKESVSDSNVLIVTALIGPFLEEIFFRLWLSFKNPHLLISLIFICFIVSIRINGLHVLKMNTHDLYVYFTYAVITGTILWSIFNITKTKAFALKHFKEIYWSSCVMFGLLHITNFAPLKLNLIWAYPIFVIPQLILGFILGFVRMKDGYFWALLVHCLVNLIL